ncbi:MAG: HAMP domain-containing sensor histidine kinase [Acidobacteria bacterium]|nr:HAMP domain-containing sensor histidine kinase [Acidobacteriota bacterium]
MKPATRPQWFSRSALIGAAIGAAGSTTAFLLFPAGSLAFRALGLGGVILAGYAFGVLGAMNRDVKRELSYVLRLRQELRLSQDYLMEGATSSSLSSYLDIAAPTLKTSLRALIDGVEALAGDEQLTGPARSRLEEIRRHCTAVESAVGPLAGYSLSRPARAPFNLNGLLREAIDLCRHRAEDKKIRFEERYSVIPPIFGPAGRMNLALVNVIINAVESMPFVGGTVEVETTHVDGRVIARIRDGGIGIRPEHMDRIYDPFFTTKPEKNSAGLGLWVTQQTLELIGATIAVESVPLKGTEVVLDFPAAAPLRAGRTGTTTPPEIERNMADEVDRRIA